MAGFEGVFSQSIHKVIHRVCGQLKNRCSSGELAFLTTLDEGKFALGMKKNLKIFFLVSKLNDGEFIREAYQQFSLLYLGYYRSMMTRILVSRYYLLG